MDNIGSIKKIGNNQFTLDELVKQLKTALGVLPFVETATRELDTQALEQILIGHMMAIAGEANQIFRPTTMFDYGIDGEVEFKDDNGEASGKKVYIQLKSGNSYLRNRKSDGSEVFEVTNERHLEYWISQPVDVYLVIRQADEATGSQTIRWMNVTRYLKKRKDKKSRQIIFAGEKLDMEAVWKVRTDSFRRRLRRESKWTQHCQHLVMRSREIGPAPKARNVKAWGNAPGKQQMTTRALKARN